MFWKKSFAAVLFVLMFGVSGCSDTSQKETVVIDTISKVQATEQNCGVETEQMIQSCLALYKKAAEERKLADLETIRGIVSRFGENGYPAVDSRNQVDMTQAEQVVRFCEQVDAREEAQISIVEVTYWGSFEKYDLQTKDGMVHVVRSTYTYKNGMMQKEETESYQADDWNYTKDGYLMFSGECFSQEQYVLTLSGAEEHTAFRVQPLDETCRELNRKYLLPISYERNNMFLVDWSEDDFGDLNFYDMYDIFYPFINGKRAPYVADDDLTVSAVYRIPKDEFERVIMAYFNIDSQTLQTKTVYDPSDAAYEYRPRGFSEAEYPEYPYSEVVGYTENSNGTIALTVHVVFPYAGDSKVYAHEVVVRPLADGGVQYVSNKIIPSEENHEITWHTPRSVKEAEEDSTESAYWFIPQASDSLISDEEKEQLQSEALSAAKLVRGIYQDAKIEDEPNYDSGVREFTGKQRRDVVEKLGENCFVSVAENVNMQNYEAVETFYEGYWNGQDSMVTVFEVQQDGLIGAVTFINRKNKLQTYYVGVRWKEGGIPEIQGTSISNVAEIKLTEKGYLIYMYEEAVAHANSREYWRIKPLSDQCRELTKKYISGLSYVNYNMLVTNWDSSNVEDILMPCMFEDIYRIDTGENLKTENWMIPAEEYEKIMTTYFPVSVEQLRKHCKYDEDSNSYEYEMINASPYPPFGEVVKYTENEDGTITLIVDGVWPDYNSDCAFTNKIVVQPFEDGTFRYLSNSVEQKELELPPMCD